MSGPRNRLAFLAVGVALAFGCGRSERTLEAGEGGESGESTGGQAPDPSGGVSGGGTNATGGRGGTGATTGGGAGLGGSAPTTGGEAGLGGTAGEGGDDLPFNVYIEVLHWLGDELYPARTGVSFRAWRAGCSECEGPRPLGTCETGSDDGGFPVCGCDPMPGACIERVAVERDGIVIDEATLDAGARALLRLDDFHETNGNRVVVEGCSARLELPIDLEGAPRPEVLETRLGEEMSGEAEFTVRWTSDLAFDLAHIAGGDAYGGVACTVDHGSASFMIPVATCPVYELTTFVVTADQTTDFGPTRLVVGQQIQGELQPEFFECSPP